ncbi:MAG: CRISPR-associated endonuclease Cas2 [Firmicutes bacterium]|nr:CRISPR-associated endonuclease Cas2 [Bacillota bacterium]
MQYSVYQIDHSNNVMDNILIELDENFRADFMETDSVIIFNIKREGDIIRYGYVAHEDEGVIIV